MTQVADLIGAIPLPVLVIGMDDRVLAENDLCLALLGEAMVGRHHITALRQPGILDAVAHVRATQMATNARYILREGEADITFNVHIAPVARDLVLTFEDQTASETAGQMRRDFVANVSHELRTPLTALMGFIETLAGAARNDAAARDRFLKIMENEASRMTRLVDDLLSLSRVEEEQRVRPQEHVDLPALIQSVAKGLEPQAAAAGVTVILPDTSLNELVLGDAGQLVQVFANLLENAIKYGRDGGHVWVDVAAPAEDPRLRLRCVNITVRDDGEGIADHHIARLTERFYRVDNHRSREVGGTGLGLAIVKHIINRHRGRMAFESLLGQGTSVTIVLPCG